MLIIPTFLGPSAIEGAGMGLFAGRAVSKGEVIWRFDERIDRLLTVLTVERLPQAAREFVYRYGCQCREDLWLLCGDNARFVNHGVPGVMACDLGGHLDGEDCALRGIDPGEEITEDYGRFALDFQRRGFYQGSDRLGKSGPREDCSGDECTMNCGPGERGNPKRELARRLLTDLHMLSDDKRRLSEIERTFEILGCHQTDSQFRYAVRAALGMNDKCGLSDLEKDVAEVHSIALRLRAALVGLLGNPDGVRSSAEYSYWESEARKAIADAQFPRIWG